MNRHRQRDWLFAALVVAFLLALAILQAAEMEHWVEVVAP